MTSLRKYHSTFATFDKVKTIFDNILGEPMHPISKFFYIKESNRMLAFGWPSLYIKIQSISLKILISSLENFKNYKLIGHSKKVRSSLNLIEIVNHRRSRWSFVRLLIIHVSILANIAIFISLKSSDYST